MKKISALCLLIFAFCVLFRPGAVQAQGFLPPSSSVSTAPIVSPASSEPLLIGQRLPETLRVTDNDSKVRTVLSYKSYLEVFVVAFFSTPCDIPSSEWARFRRLDEGGPTIGAWPFWP